MVIVLTYLYRLLSPLFSVSVIGDVAKKIFDNIRKRFNKARNRIKTSSKSGISTKESKDIADIPTGYKFLQWLTPYINPRKTKNNFVVTEEASSQDFRGNSGDEEAQQEDDFREDFREELKLPEPVKLDNQLLVIVLPISNRKIRKYPL